MQDILLIAAVLILQLFMMAYGWIMFFYPQKVMDWNNSQMVNSKGELYPWTKFSLWMFGDIRKKWWFIYQMRGIGLLLMFFSILGICIFVYNVNRGVNL